MPEADGAAAPILKELFAVELVSKMFCLYVVRPGLWRVHAVLSDVTRVVSLPCETRKTYSLPLRILQHVLEPVDVFDYGDDL